jgi:hypothetical protein
MGALFLLGFIKGPDSIGAIQGGYPHPICRWLDIMKTETEEMSKDSGAAEYFEERLKAAGSSLAKERKAVDKIISSFPECHITWNGIPQQGDTPK